jgi:FkbM family methyltransferase
MNTDEMNSNSRQALSRRLLSLGFRAGSRVTSKLLSFLPFRLRKRLRKLRKRLERDLRLVRSLGPWAVSAARRLAEAERSAVGEVPIRIGTGRAITLRAGTTDTNVFRQHFISRELYDIPKLDSPDVIVDLGAHIGIATEVFRRQYPTARIISVEMDSANYDLCARNHASTPAQVSVHAAVWSSTGVVTTEDVGEGNWAFRARGVDRSGSVEAPRTSGPQVPAISFGDFVREYGLDHISILKIDIEGSEAELLESAWREIFGITELVVMEVHDWISGIRDRVEAVLGETRQEFDLAITQAGEFMCIRPTKRALTSSAERMVVA